MYTKAQQTGRKKKIKISTADAWFSKFIRIRDISYGLYCRCITCGKALDWKYDAQCGHFATRGHPMTRFNERNCHAQCAQCNDQNQGEQALHGFAIDDMYGENTSRELMGLSRIRGQKLHTPMALKDIAKEYRLKAKKLAKEKGIEL